MEHTVLIQHEVEGYSHSMRASLLETSISGQISRCVCFSPRFRFLLDSSLILLNSGGRTRLEGRPRRRGGQLCSTSFCFRCLPDPPHSDHHQHPPGKRMSCPASAAHNNHNNTARPLTTFNTTLGQPNFPKSAAPWNWIVQRS